MSPGPYIFILIPRSLILASDAANDAHCALIIYERLMNLARENKVTLDAEKYTQDVKWYHVKKKSDSATEHKTPSAPFVNKPSSASSSKTTLPSGTPVATQEYLPLYADDDVPMVDASSTRARTAEESEALAGPSKKPKFENSTSTFSNRRSNTKGFVKQRPQHIRSYNLWYGMNMPLGEMCKTLRAPDNPLKVGTVMSDIITHNFSSSAANQLATEGMSSARFKQILLCDLATKRSKCCSSRRRRLSKGISFGSRH